MFAVVTPLDMAAQRRGAAQFNGAHGAPLRRDSDAPRAWR
jgi:hypothetical protein